MAWRARKRETGIAVGRQLEWPRAQETRARLSKAAGMGEGPEL